MSISDFENKKPAEDKTEWSEPKAETPTEAPPETPTTAPTEVSEPSPAPTPPAGAAQINDIAAKILGRIGDIGSHSRLKLMVFGPPGGAKSSFGATAPNNLIADFEDGLISAKVSPNGIAPGVQALPLKGFQEFVETVKLILADHPNLKDFEVFTVDTLSDLHKVGLADVLNREYKRRPESINRYVAETEHHTENNEKILRLVRALRDTDRDLLIISHSRTVEPKNKPAKTYADFSESLSNKIMAMMDVVGYMEMREIDGKLTPVMTFAHETIHCKSRIGLPDEVANPTWPQIKKIWEQTVRK